MSRMRLIDLLSHPQELDEKTLDMLKEALDAYPFFQAGRMLWIKNLHKLDHIRYNNELKLGAAFIPDRSKLFFLINDVFSSLSGPEDIAADYESNSTEVENDSDSDATQVDCSLDEESPAGENFSNIEEDTDSYSSEEDLSRIVGAEANYFEVDDSITSATGEIIDFSLAEVNEDIEEDPQDDDDLEETLISQDDDESITVPADLLDYEKESFSSAYSIEEEVPPTSLDFNENHSFSEWLNLLKHQPAQDPVEEEKESKNNFQGKPKKSGMDLIESFLNNSGSEKRILPRKEKEVTNEDFSTNSVAESDDLMTETLANIHIKQERYQKAIEIFERLSLKYPEKSVYFARRIKEMEDLINNQ